MDDELRTLCKFDYLGIIVGRKKKENREYARLLHDQYTYMKMCVYKKHSIFGWICTLIVLKKKMQLFE